ncbi:MAG: M15 family metallopeptidase [Bacilli bacterium]
MKKKKRVSKRGKLLILSFVIILILLINPIRQYKKIKLMFIGYDKKSINYILKDKLETNLFNNKYNKTIDKIVVEKAFNKNNYKVYSQLDYYNYKDFTTNNNKLIKMKYTPEEINLINKRGNNDDIINFLKFKKIDFLKEFLKLDYAKLKYVERYYNYKLDNGLSSLEAVIDVNIGLDQAFYTNPFLVKEFSYDMLVNKYNYVDKDYQPTNLVKISNDYATDNGAYANEKVVDAFIKMADDMKKENLFILANSTYRTFLDQKSIYDDYKKDYGEKAADNYAARPGFSEHQTGLCIDVANKNRDLFVSTKEYKYMIENAYKYGFILRYPKGRESITGYKFEAWHFRYLGVDLATKVYKSKLTYDEYYIMNLDK